MIGFRGDEARLRSEGFTCGDCDSPSQRSNSIAGIFVISRVVFEPIAKVVSPSEYRLVFGVRDDADADRRTSSFTCDFFELVAVAGGRTITPFCLEGTLGKLLVFGCLARRSRMQKIK